MKSDDANKQLKSDLAECFALTGKALTAKGDQAHAIENYRRALSLAEESLQEKFGNVRIKSRLAAHFFEAGKIFAGFAQSERSEKLKAESCDYLNRSFAVWSEMKQSKTLTAVNASPSDEVAQELNKCL